MALYDTTIERTLLVDASGLDRHISALLVSPETTDARLDNEDPWSARDPAIPIASSRRHVDLRLRPAISADLGLVDRLGLVQSCRAGSSDMCQSGQTDAGTRRINMSLTRYFVAPSA